MNSIGQRIEEVLKESGMQPKVFAERIGTSPRNLYNIFTRDSIDTALLAKISEVLRYDFFKLFQTDIEQDPKSNKDKKRRPKFYIQIEVDDPEQEKQIMKILKMI